VCCQSQFGFRKIFVHLAYLDDSQDQTQSSIAMFGALVIPSGEFGWAERMHSIAVEQLFSPDEIEEKFQEFHARDLFKGEGPFQGIDERKRFTAIEVLLMALRHYRLPFIYSAVDVQKLAKSALSRSLFETANPLVAAFKLCLLGVEKWAQSQHEHPVPGVVKIDYNDQYLLVVDETKDHELKKRLRNSYRLLRAARPYMKAFNRLWHAHDAMFFGDSRDSVGIQLADLCAYFMQRQLLKRDADAKDDSDEFYSKFSSQVICAKPEPEWTDYRELLLSHESD
jgi:hypothetical protein